MAAQHKTEQIGVRLTPGQMRQIQARAEAQGYRVSEWVRQAALEKAWRESGRATEEAARAA